MKNRDYIILVSQSIFFTIGLLFIFDDSKPFEVAFKNSMMKSGVLSTVLFLSFFYILYTKKTFFYEIKLSFIQWLISLFLAFNQLFRVSLQSTQNLDVIFKSIPNVIVSLIILYTFTFIFNTIQGVIEKLLQREYSPLESESKIMNKFYKNPFLFSFILIIICWIPIILINYPSILVVDAFRQMRQYYGEVPIANAHPPIHTIMFGLSIDLGRKLGSADLGLFLSNVPQILLTATGFSLTSVTLKRLRVPKFILYINLIIGCFSPAILGMLMVSTKDLLFSSSVLVLYNIVVLYLIIENKKVKDRVFYGIFFIIMSTLVILFRKNGIFMIYPILLIFMIKTIISTVSVIKNKGKDKTSILISLGVTVILFIPIFLSQKIDNALEMKYSMEEDVKKSEMLSIPFQQTARYVKKYPEEVTSSEEKVIRKVLDYENLEKLYVPHVSDNVKRTNPRDTTKEEFREYFITWYKMFLKHPEVYVEATASQNYYMFSFENLNNYYMYLENGYYKKKNVPEGEKYQEIMSKLGITHRDNKMGIQANLVRVYKMIDSIPILNFISNFSVWIVLLLLMFGISIKKKCYQTLLLTIPMIMLLATIFAGPIIRGYVRYGLPFILVGPLLIGMLFFETNKEKNKIIL
ncbi:hypothetical protein DOK76_02135 [Vagococcus sp. DIV0080]|uniref:Glycosyltransferase RgtA/B/C/D-like domain-containing protein n=1 Tax=Candidatus Vagococcus giribetii TaxID=2230876 RepID=A0ABS3HSL0_9ENTE|nr:DUF6020 family protein [Vagococcus sp. DIV0080]MBO0475851.1 hypothetical protein [Vagococcus sp. DIV0080]